MLDSPFDFFALVIAIVAFIFARKAFNQATALRARLDAIEATGLQARSAPPPLTPQQLEQTLAEPVAPVAGDETTAPQDAGGTASAPPPLSQPSPGFEERIGTRWVVWVGGLTLALGGFFMVRYSIDAGLLGPGVRIEPCVRVALQRRWCRPMERIKGSCELWKRGRLKYSAPDVAVAKRPLNS